MSNIFLFIFMILLAAWILITLWADAVPRSGDACPDCGGPLDYAGDGQWDCPHCSDF